MPRLPRLDLPGFFYHVIVRGVEQRSIFLDDRDKTDFLGRLAKNLQLTGSLCLAWSLMTNHLHLLIVAGPQGLASLMHPVLLGYAGAFNRRYGRVGHLVQNRFKAILCDADAYLRELIRYIHLNPVRAGIVKTIQELAAFPWTGHQAMTGRLTLPWQATDEALQWFGATPAAARLSYQNFLEDGWNGGDRDEFEGVNIRQFLLRQGLLGTKDAWDPRILGSGDFVQKIWKKTDDAERERALVLKSGASLEDIERVAAALTGADSQDLLRRDRRPAVHKARALAIYGAMDFLQISGAALASRFKMRSSGIAKARSRGRRLDEARTLSDYISQSMQPLH